MALISMRSLDNIPVTWLMQSQGLLKQSNSVSVGRYEPIIHAAGLYLQAFVNLQSLTV